MVEGSNSNRRSKVSQATGVKTATATESSKQTSQNRLAPEQIRQRVYEIYVSRNGAPDDDVQDWLQAERELSSGSHKEVSGGCTSNN